MTTISKFDELVGEAFLNAMRLHLDSMILCKNGSYSSALQLATEASQEISKTIVLEHLLSLSLRSHGKVCDASIERSLIDTFSSHRLQSRQVQKTIRHLSKSPETADLALLIQKVSMQSAEEQRDKLTYVGLTKKNRKIDLNGKKVLPRLNGRNEKARRQITTNNDFLAVYISGFLAEAYVVMSDSMAWEMNHETLQILRLEWPQVGRKAARLLTLYKNKHVVEDASQYTAEDTVSATDETVSFESRAIVVH